MTILRYSNTNTFFIPARSGGLLVDTGYAGSLGAFYREIKQNHDDQREVFILDIMREGIKNGDPRLQ